MIISKSSAGIVIVRGLKTIWAKGLSLMVGAALAPVEYALAHNIPLDKSVGAQSLSAALFVFLGLLTTAPKDAKKEFIPNPNAVPQTAPPPAPTGAQMATLAKQVAALLLEKAIVRVETPIPAAAPSPTPNSATPDATQEAAEDAVAASGGTE